MIVPDTQSRAPGSHVIDVDGTLAFWETRGILQHDISAILADIISTMAGAEAEMMIVAVQAALLANGRSSR